MIALFRADGTNMVRTAVTLVLLVPLLMPPGLCICGPGAASHPARRDVDPSGPAAKAHRCPCCAAGKNHRRSAPPDPPHNHAPACPVVKLAGGYGLVKPERYALTLAQEPAGWADVLEIALAPTFAPTPSPDFRPPTAPLFLTLRTILI